MAITGHTKELSLSDLLQIRAMNGGTCRVIVDGPFGAGVLVLEEGLVVHARYGGLEGEDAAYLLLSEDETFFQASAGVEIPRRTLALPVHELLMRCAQRKDEGTLPRPTVPLAEPASSEVFVELSPVAVDAPGATSFGLSRRSALIAALATAVLVVAVVLVTRLGDAPTAIGTADAAEASTAPKPPALESSAGAGEALEPVEASELDGAADRLPMLEIGRPPASPDPTTAMRPTIICRLLVGDDGRVIEAEIYRPREELAAFEKVALDTVRGYRFSPGRRQGVAVPVWINWPVDFI
ncbi:MAG: DUF4388 domain-containing protein [Acidobacteria bacterium]|nr:DUF4388 domain-containing protein [Acidobacteriota bacterium]